MFVYLVGNRFKIVMNRSQDSDTDIIENSWDKIKIVWSHLGLRPANKQAMIQGDFFTGTPPKKFLVLKS